MSLSRVGVGNGTNTWTVPAHNIGDEIVTFAFRTGSTTPPALAAGFTTIATIVGTNCSARISCRIATSTSDTAGTSTNATATVGEVWTSSLYGSGASLAIGGFATTHASSLTVNFPALTMTNAGGTSWVAGFAGVSNTSQTISTAPAGMVNQSLETAAASQAAGFDTNGTVSSWSSTNAVDTGTAGNTCSCTLEICENVPAVTSLANMVQHRVTQPNSIASVNESLNNLAVTKPDPTLAGNGLLLVVEYPSGATPVITDDKSNTWPASGAAGTVTADAGAGNMAIQAFVLASAATGTQTVKIGFGSTVQQPVRAKLTELYNVTGTLNGSVTAAAVNTAGVVSPGSFTPTAANSLVFAYMGNSNTLGATNPSLIQAANGYALNDSDVSWTQGQGVPSASQYALQTTAVATTPLFNLAQGGTDTYNVIAFALSTGTQGTPKPSTIHIDRLIDFSVNSTPASWLFQVPQSGNLGVLGSPEDLLNTGTVPITDSDAVTWSHPTPVAGSPIFLYRANSPANPSRTVTLNLTGATGTNSNWRYLDVSNAAVSPLDVFAALGSQTTNNLNSFSNAPSITPTQSGDLVIAIMQNGLGPTLGCTTTGAVYTEPSYQIAQFTATIAGTTLTVSATAWGVNPLGIGATVIQGSGVTLGTSVQSGTGPTYTVNPSQTVSSATTMQEVSTDSSNVNWGNGMAILYNAPASAINWAWTFSNQPSSSITASAIAFKTAPAAGASAWDDDFGDFPQILAGEDEGHEAEATAILCMTYESAPVGPNAVPLQSQDEWPFFDWGDQYEEPLVNDLEWSGPIQPNAPPEIFRDDELISLGLLESIDEESLDFTGEGGVGPNAVFLQYYGEDAEQPPVDDIDEQWFEFDAAPVGLNATFAQYFGEDAERVFLEDESAADELLLDEPAQPVIAAAVVDDPWPHFDDETQEETLDLEGAASVNPAAVFAQYFGEDADVGVLDDATDEETLDLNGDGSVGSGATFAQYYGEDAELDQCDDSTHEETLDWDSQPVGAPASFAQYFGEDADVAIADDASDEETLDYDGPPVGPSASVAQYFGEDSEALFLEDEASTDDLLLDEVQQPLVLATPAEDAWPHFDDEGAEEPADSDSAPVGAAGIAAQYYGEDAESGLFDEIDEGEPPQDDVLQQLPPTIQPLQYFGEDAEAWHDDQDEPYLDFDGTPAGAAATFAQYFGEDAELSTLHDEQGEEILDTDQALGANAPQIDTSQLGGHEWQQDDDELEDWALLSLDAQIGANAGAAAIDDAWDHFADESLEEFLPPDDAQLITLVIQPPEDAWDWAADESLEEFLPPDEPVGAPFVLPAAIEDGWDWSGDETLEEYLDTDQALGTSLNPLLTIEDAWDWAADETLEETLDFFDQPTGANARFAQYFGEDAETDFLEDESSTEDVLLDALSPPPLLFPSNDIVFYIPQLAVAYTAQGEVLYIPQNQVVYMPLSPQLQKFRPKLPSEEQVLTFNMSAALTGGNLLVGTPTVVSVTSVRGDDPTPTAILNGPPALDSTSTLILVPVKGGIPNSSYIIEVNCASQQPPVQPSLAAILPIGHP